MCAVAELTLEAVSIDEAMPSDAGDAGFICTPDATLPPGEPLDLVPYARLWASGTQPNSGLPWPRESDDAIATVRDSDPANGWKAPVGKKSTVFIDLQPWLGRAVALDTLSASYTGTHPEIVTVDLLDGCGGTPSRTISWRDLATPLDLAGSRAGCVEISMTTKDAISLRALSLSSRERWIPDPENFPQAGTSGGTAGAATPRHHASGVIEGFYGAPWSWRERQHMVKTMAALGLGAYVYGPKLDPKHRAKWREAYTAAEMDEFRRLNAYAAREGIVFMFGLSPFIDYDPSTDADYQTLEAKLGAALGVGITGIVVMADDIEFATTVEVGAELAQIHAGAVNRLYADLKAQEPRLAMWFVGTVYSDERTKAWAGGQAYLEGLKALDPAVEVMWTGTATSSVTMTGAEMAAVTAATGRKPVIWDNFWANDGGDGFQGKLLLGAFSGRGPDLPPAVGGICQNPGIQGALARLQLATFGDWLDDPSRTDPDALRAYAAAIERLHLLPAGGDVKIICGDGSSGGLGSDTHLSTTPDGVELIPLVMKVFEGGAMGDASYRDMESAMDALAAAAQPGNGLPLAEASGALQVFARMATLRSEVRHSLLDPDLVDELEFPLEKVRYDGLAGLATLAVLGEKLAGRDGGAFSSDYQRASLKSGENRFVYSAGKIDAFYKKIGALAPRTAGFSAPAIAAPGACVTGQPLSFKAADGATVLVSGLAGATVSGGTVSWTPPHGGTYDAVVTATTGQGWASATATIVCEPQK